VDIKNLMSVLSVAAFIVFILVSTDVRRNYLLYVVYVLPFMDLFITTQDFGGYRVFNFITYIALILLIGKPALFKNPNPIYRFLFILMCFILVISSLKSEFVGESLIFLSEFITIFVYAILLINECHEHPHFKYVILRGIKTSCLLSLVFLACQLVFGLSVTLYKLNPNASSYDALIRYPSYFEDPQKYGQFLAICSFLFLIEDPGKKQRSLINICLFFTVVVALFLTGVRAAFSGLCAGMAIIFLFGGSKYKLLGVAGCLLGAIIVTFYASHFAIFNRGSDVNDTAVVRYAYWADAWRIFLLNPYLGIGIGNYQHYVSLHSQHQYWYYFGTYEYIDHPESGYFKVLVEFGIFGFITHQAFIFAPMVQSIKNLLYRPAESKMLLFLIAAIVSWILAFFTVYSLGDLRIFILVVTLLCIMIAFSPDATQQISYEN
jgi:O-antigen ligase